MFTRKTNIQNDLRTDHIKLVDAFVHMEEALNGLPELSDVEKVQLEQEIAISHLYHSSKIEGTTLNEERLEKAINA